MCGIVGGFAYGEVTPEEEALRQRILRIFTTELLLQTEVRGEDATGAVALFNNGQYFGLKRGVKARELMIKFDTNEFYEALIKTWAGLKESHVRAYLGHCRKGTLGGKEDNRNNHPIKVGPIVGIHNGAIKNHYHIFERLGAKRDGQVDSEAIFHLLNHFTNNGKEPFTNEVIQEVVDRLEGEFAVMAFNQDNQDQIPIFCDGRPVEIMVMTKLGLVFVASEKRFFYETQFIYERMRRYYKVPSLVSSFDGMGIGYLSMPKARSLILDLTRNISDAKTFGDLGEFNTLGRTERLWRTALPKPAPKAAATTATAGATAAASTSTTARTTHGTAINTFGPDEKRYVFNEATQSYDLMQGENILTESPKTPPEEESSDTKLIAATNNYAGANPAIEDDVTTANRSTPAQLAAAAGERLAKATGLKAEVVDNTTYDAEFEAERSKAQHNRSAASLATGDLDGDDTLIGETSVKQVDMEVDPPEIVSQAEEAFNKLPSDKHGYRDDSGMLDDARMVDIATVKKYSPLILANRIFAAAWKAGYRACLLAKKSNNIDDKLKKQEEYIKNLKGMTLLFALFFNKISDGEQKEMAATTMELVRKNNQGLPVPKSVSGIMNAWESRQMENLMKSLKDN